MNTFQTQLEQTNVKKPQSVYNKNMLKVCVLFSNLIKVSPHTKKGTEVWGSIFLEGLASYAQVHPNDIEVTVYASGDSQVPFPVRTNTPIATADCKDLTHNERKLLELQLVSLAFANQDAFDVFHIHISNGEYILPFLPFVKKPVLVTMHGTINTQANKEYFHTSTAQGRVHFIAISEHQKSMMPDLPYTDVIHHGINTAHDFIFGPTGGSRIMWAGQAIPEKGLDQVLHVVEETKHPAMVFPMIKPHMLEWIEQILLSNQDELSSRLDLQVNVNLSRLELTSHYRDAKVFLFPICWEEPFGLVMIEALASGTPVVAYARGAAPEIIKDGYTGYLINPSDDDKRGSFTIHQAGIQGLIKAVEKIYALPDDEYRQLRANCRRHAEEYFSVEKMVQKYVDVYEKIT